MGSFCGSRHEVEVLFPFESESSTGSWFECLSPAGGPILGSCGTFRRCSLAGGSRPLGDTSAS